MNVFVAGATRAIRRPLIAELILQESFDERGNGFSGTAMWYE